MEGLGIDLKYLLFQLGNFAVLLGGLTWLLHKPLTKLLDERRSEVAESLESAARIRKEVIETEKRQHELLEQARAEAAASIAAARKQAEELEKRLEGESTAKAESLLKKAADQIAADREQMRRELRQELAGVVMTATEQVLGSPLSADDKRERVAKIVHDLKA
jgi:F-type H+-transporting ATPase subunit b